MSKHRNLIHKLLLIDKITKQCDIQFLLKQNLVSLQFQKIILVDDLNTITHAFQYISLVTSFHHIKFNGQRYYETSNMWETHKIKKRPKYDIDHPCYGYGECELSTLIYPKGEDLIRYVLRCNYDVAEMLSQDEQPKFLKFVEQMSKYKLKNVMFVGFNNLTIKNTCGRNEDHRGSNHCNIYLPMHDKVVMTKFATLYDLAIAYYRLKSHKWDRWYELFSYAMPVRKKNDIIVNLVFDHGS
uniref:Uncharacterized protein n=1 Tax=viral metagenome TaxID=1070528 RepID=A0A6C0C9F3_9ZZZZ